MRRPNRRENSDSHLGAFPGHRTRGMELLLSAQTANIDKEEKKIRLLIQRQKNAVSEKLGALRKQMENHSKESSNRSILRFMASNPALGYSKFQLEDRSNRGPTTEDLSKHTVTKLKVKGLYVLGAPETIYSREKYVYGLRNLPDSRLFKEAECMNRSATNTKRMALEEEIALERMNMNVLRTKMGAFMGHMPYSEAKRRSIYSPTEFKFPDRSDPNHNDLVANFNDGRRRTFGIRFQEEWYKARNDQSM